MQSVQVTNKNLRIESPRNIKQEETEPEIDPTSPEALLIPPREVPWTMLSEYQNPFENLKFQKLYRREGLVTVIGCPGIGKTMFLRVIFRLRMAANLPTIFMDSATKALIYKNGKLSVLNSPQIYTLRANAPDDTWFLIDSSNELVGIPLDVLKTRFFIIQAASPRPEHLRYTYKLSGNSLHQFCFMKPWSLLELIAGADLLNEDVRPQQAQINGFFVAYGGSARNVFSYAGDLEYFEAMVDVRARELERGSVEKIIRNPIPHIEIPDDIGHVLLSAFPLGEDQDRRFFQIRPPCESMYRRVLKAVDDVEADARLSLYRTCERVDTPGCQMWAAYLYDSFFQDYLVKGGSRPLRIFKKTLLNAKEGAGTHEWIADENECGKYFKVDDGMDVVSSTDLLWLPAAAQHLVMNKEQEPVTGETLQPKVYYRPTRRNFPTFDDFYVFCHEQEHALCMQTSLEVRHTANKQGLQWLRDRGIKKVTYIYITPGRVNAPIVTVPVEFEDMLINVYHMVLDF
ncbi:hypothetical protein B0H12DRAFT_588297 [Mycena haematopus]|nr:hypothetical protein B0H12DRAFT_588297 [Mycena haematopus]